MEDYTLGEVVNIRDRPLGQPTKIKGKIVGILPQGYYNILLTNGLNQGNIIKYGFFEIIEEGYKSNVQSRASRPKKNHNYCR